MKICLILTKTQTEILSMAIAGITREDLRSFGRHIGPVVKYHLEKISDRLVTRLAQGIGPGRTYKMSLTQADAGALMIAFSHIHYNITPESALIRVILDEIDRYF